MFLVFIQISEAENSIVYHNLDDGGCIWHDKVYNPCPKEAKEEIIKSSSFYQNSPFNTERTYTPRPIVRTAKQQLGSGIIKIISQISGLSEGIIGILFIILCLGFLTFICIASLIDYIRKKNNSFSHLLQNINDVFLKPFLSKISLMLISINLYQNRTRKKVMSYDEGKEEFKKGNYHKAAKKFQELIDKNENDDKAWNSLGVCYSKLEQYENANICFENALTINGDNSIYKKNFEKNKIKIKSTNNKKNSKFNLNIQSNLKKEKNKNSYNFWAISFVIALLLIIVIVYTGLTFSTHSILNKQAESSDKKLSASEYNNQAIQLFKNNNDLLALSSAEKAISLNSYDSIGAYAVKVLILFKQGKKEEVQKVFNECISKIGGQSGNFFVSLTTLSDESGIKLELDGYSPTYPTSKNDSSRNHDELFVNTLNEMTSSTNSDITATTDSINKKDWDTLEKQNILLKEKFGKNLDTLRALTVSDKYKELKENAILMYSEFYESRDTMSLLVNSSRIGDKEKIEYYSSIYTNQTDKAGETALKAAKIYESLSSSENVISSINTNIPTPPNSLPKVSESSQNNEIPNTLADIEFYGAFGGLLLRIGYNRCFNYGFNCRKILLGWGNFRKS